MMHDDADFRQIFASIIRTDSFKEIVDKMNDIKCKKRPNLTTTKRLKYKEAIMQNYNRCQDSCKLAIIID